MTLVIVFHFQKQMKKREPIILLPELFKSDDRVRILRYVSERKSVTVQSTAEATGVSKPVVSRYLNALREQGLCERTGRKISWVQSPRGSAVKRFLNIVLLDEHLPSPEWAKGIGIYGSWARGTNTMESDLDLWILVDTYSRDLEFQVAGFQHELAQALGYEVHSLILTREKLRDLSRKDAPFHEEFIRDYVVIRGEGIDKA
jgi:predicted nucleotidyltransferase